MNFTNGLDEDWDEQCGLSQEECVSTLKAPDHLKRKMCLNHLCSYLPALLCQNLESILLKCFGRKTHS